MHETNIAHWFAGSRTACAAAPPAASGDAVWRTRAGWLIGALLVFRLAYAAWMPLNLIYDEAYYWDWSRRLDWCYYSKPPMVAWLIALSTSLLGDSEFGVRLPAVILGTLGLVWVYLLAARMFNPRVGFIATLLLAATPGSAIVGLMMTIDPPFLFCWSAAMYALWRLFEQPAQRWRWTLMAVLATGLGLLSKQTTVALIPLTGMFLLTSRTDRIELRRPWYWLWVGGSLLFTLPVLWWNSQQGWITAGHTRGHFSGQSGDIGQRLARFAECFAAQAAVVSPLTWLLCVVVIGAAMLAPWRLGRRERFLLCYCALPLAGVVALCLTRRVQPNWPAAFYTVGILLVAAWIDGSAQIPRLPTPNFRLFVHAARVGLAMVAITYLLPPGLSWVGLAGSSVDPVVRLRGWREVGDAIAPQLAQVQHPNKTLVLVLDSAGRDLASEMAYYLPGRPIVYLWPNRGPVTSQYRIWGGPQGCEGWDALIIGDWNAALPPHALTDFEHVQEISLVEVSVGGHRRHQYRLWQATGYRGPRGDQANDYVAAVAPNESPLR